MSSIEPLTLGLNLDISQLTSDKNRSGVAFTLGLPENVSDEQIAKAYSLHIMSLLRGQLDGRSEISINYLKLGGDQSESHQEHTENDTFVEEEVTPPIDWSQAAEVKHEATDWTPSPEDTYADPISVESVDIENDSIVENLYPSVISAIALSIFEKTSTGEDIISIGYNIGEGIDFKNLEMNISKFGGGKPYDVKYDEELDLGSYSVTSKFGETEATEYYSLSEGDN